MEQISTTPLVTSTVFTISRHGRIFRLTLAIHEVLRDVTTSKSGGAARRTSTRSTRATQAVVTCSCMGFARSRSSVDTTKTDRGTYGYYEVNDFRTKDQPAARLTTSISRIAGGSVVLSSQPRCSHSRTNNSIVPPRHSGQRLRIRLADKDCSTSGRDLRRVRRREDENLRKLGPVLRLG